MRNNNEIRRVLKYIPVKKVCIDDKEKYLFFKTILLGLLFGLIIGMIFGGYIATKDAITYEQYDYYGSRMFNQGYTQCKDNWINSLIGLKDSCYYETNENNTMVRYVCGELTNGWKAI